MKHLFILVAIIFSSSAYAQYNTNTQENWDDLMHAVANNDTVTVKKLVEEGADINKLYNGRYTPFMYACENGLLESVLLILSFEGVHQADLSIFDPMGGQTGFMLAVWKGHKDIVIAILEKSPFEKNVTDFRDKKAIDYTTDPEMINILSNNR